MLKLQGPTVDVPLDAPGGDLQRVIDSLQNRLQLLLLGNLRLGHLCNIQLLTFKLFYRTETQGQIRIWMWGRSQGVQNSSQIKPIRRSHIVKQTEICTKELLENLSIIEIFSQVLHNDPFPNQNIIDPVDKHLIQAKSWVQFGKTYG